ncbi:hypothetical protein SAMN05421797_10355 [Maribacter ulvicola]|uniref:Uncharacterized protein n=1 Tax=Maribacter ulvicola TaxID=228959 RepID=A0A1N6VAS0_9FLAO|nr:hypothetical protein SAMN05421797_10355 [Maribacter ulvicola]
MPFLDKGYFLVQKKGKAYLCKLRYLYAYTRRSKSERKYYN